MRPIIIVEGAELTGKSFIISQIYQALQPRFQTHPHILNGCHWFNCDVGILGDVYGDNFISSYLGLAESMPDRILLFEKFHLSHAVYSKIYSNADFSYNTIESRLAQRGAVLLLCSIDDSESIWRQRLNDRLKLYPHYKRIAQEPTDYQNQQQLYRAYFNQSQLPKLEIDSTKLPNDQLITSILTWLEPYLK